MRNSVLSSVAAFFRSCFCWDRAFTKRVLFLCVPLVLQDFVSASLHIVDGLMVSGLGDAAYSAVMQASRITFLFQLFLFGISSGSAIFFSQFWGQRDIDRFRRSMGPALATACLISLFFAAAGLFFPHKLISFFLPPGESFTLATDYLRTVAPSFPLAAIGSIYASALKAEEKTYLPMIAVTISLLADTLVSYVLIYGLWGFPALGVQGAALGTLLSFSLSPALNLAFAYSKKLASGVGLRPLLHWDFAFVRKFFQTALPVVFNEGLWAMGTVMYSVFYGTMGDISVSAIGVYTTINDLMWVLIMALTYATAIVVGNTLGTGDRDLAYLYSKRLMAGGTLLALFLGVLILSFHGALVGLFSGLSPEARHIASNLLVLSSFFLWMRAFNCINVVGLLRSGGDTVFSLILDGGVIWFVGVPAAGAAALWFRWPIEAVYLCTLLDELIKMIIGIPHFYHKKWMNVLIESKEEPAHGNP